MTTAARERFRLWLQPRNPVREWPFAAAPAELAASLPAVLPGALDDFAVCLPEDHVNETHGPLPRAAASVRTELAVYRRGDALVVVLRCWHGEPLVPRLAPAQRDSGQLFFAASAAANEGLYVGFNDRGESLVHRLVGLCPDSSGDPLRHLPGPPGITMTPATGDGWWAMLSEVPLAAIPGLSQGAHELACTAGRLWGETLEPSCWTSPISWAPMRALLGTLELAAAPPPAAPALYRLDLHYDPASETGELELRLDRPADASLELTVNTVSRRVTAIAGVARAPLALEDGTTHVAVKVGEQRSVRVAFEKWSGHHLHPRPPAAPPLPTLAELRAEFAAAHARQEQQYRAPGTWGPAQPAAKPLGYDHHCAFPMEPYAWACLCLDRQEVYLARVRESCERILAGIRPEGWIPCFHHDRDPGPFNGGAFGHGSASEALCLGYRVLGDDRYLAAARHTATAYRLYPLEYNTNYMAFVLWHLAELYELTADPACLETACWYLRHGILRGLTPGGNFPGHNYYTAYGNITLKGLAKLWRVLPANHPERPRLAEAATRCANQMLARQLANGLFDGRNRMYFGYQHTLPGLFEYARAAGPAAAARLAPVFAAMYHGQTAQQRQQGTHARTMLDIALLARYLSEGTMPQ
jgi:hypothetical protein